MIALADCAVSVSNAKQASEWWKSKLGFVVHVVGKGPHAVMVAPPGDKFVLHLCEGFEAVQPGNTGIAFVSDDLDTLVARMVDAGVQFTEPLSRGSWGAKAMFADPDGNIFWLIEAPTAFIRAEVSRIATADRPGRSGPRMSGRGRPRNRRSK